VDDDSPRPVVLNVEDYEPSRFLRTVVLQRAGFDVIEARCGEEAIQAAAARAPNVALVDVNLPDTDGFRLCAELKRRYPAAPILLISAVHLAESLSLAGQAVGAHGFLSEPVEPNTLVDRVCRALEGVTDEESATWAITDRSGYILDVSPAAAHLLNITASHLRRRQLVVFFAADRMTWHATLSAAQSGHVEHRVGVLRPRDKRPVDVEVTVRAAADRPEPDALLWTFRAATRK
jgi:DNA-binding response OmpR family regulator